MWINPKTNWGNSDNDTVEFSDYNRIKNNMLYLTELAYELYGEFPVHLMGNDKSYRDYQFASDYNALEKNIDAIYNNTFKFDGKKPSNIYFPNNTFVSYGDLNRIESTQFTIHRYLEAQRKARKKLAFRLGGDSLC